MLVFGLGYLAALFFVQLGRVHIPNMDSALLPGLAVLMQGEASCARIITRDRLSRVRLVGAGRPGYDRTLLTSPRLVLCLSALHFSDARSEPAPGSL